MAGLVCYYNYDNYQYLRVTRDEELGTCICVTSVNNREITESEYVKLSEDVECYYLKAVIKGVDLEFLMSYDNKTFMKIGETLDMRILSDEHVEGNGFTGAMVGMCCQDLQGDGCYADFDWFEYKKKEE